MKLFTLWLLFLGPDGIVDESRQAQQYYGTYGKHLCVKDSLKAEQYFATLGREVKAECRSSDVQYLTIDRDRIHLKS